MMKPVVMFFVVAFVLAVSASVDARTWYVPSECPTIQAGIDSAVAGDTVLVADGTYTGPGNKNLSFGGKAITVRSENGPENCVIDCDGYPHRGFNFDSGETGTSVVDGFTIQNGRASYGGGVRCGYGSSPRITNCTISGNSAYYNGGGVSCYGNDAEFTNCTISGNSADDNGGGIKCKNSSPTFTNCVISDNSANGVGGGVFCWDSSSPTFTNCTFSSNSADDNAGGVGCWSSSSPTITNCILWGNQPQEIYIYSGDVAATYSDIQGGWPGTGNIDCDPMFCYPDTGNYYLHESSCCVGAGCDSLGNPDPTVDIGAWPVGCSLPSPEVTSNSPEQNELNVPVNANISVTFDMDMDETTINDSTLVVNARSTGLHEGTITYNSPAETATFDPDSSFFVGEVVTVVLTTDIKSSQGVPLDSSYVWSFTLEVNNGSGTFAPRSTYPVMAGDPCSIFSADLDGDGDLDLVTANSYTNNVSVLLNNGDGTFTTHLRTPVGSYPQSVFSADLDGDGDLDLATANEDAHNVSVLLNNGYATFSSHSVYAVGTYPHSIFSADLDGDGDLDLATANWGTDDVSVLLNNGNATFAPHSVYPAGDYTYPLSVFCADLDGDGDLDLVTANSYTNNVSVLLNNGDGTFAPDSVYPVGSEPQALLCADFDGDGDVDLAAASFGEDSVSVLLNNGEASFAPYSSYAVGWGPVSAFAADLDGDGDLDLAAANIHSSDVSVLLNNGDGSFAPHSVYPMGDDTHPVSVFCADLDGDGDIDLAAPNWVTGNVSVLLNQPGFVRGDANGDGIIDVGDVVYLVSYLYKNGPAPSPAEAGDANCDEIVDLGDVVYLVSYLYKNGPPPGCPKGSVFIPQRSGRASD